MQALPSRLHGEIAQLVEHTTENRGVPGSSPGLAIVLSSEARCSGWRLDRPGAGATCGELRPRRSASWFPASSRGPGRARNACKTALAVASRRALCGSKRPIGLSAFSVRPNRVAEVVSVLAIENVPAAINQIAQTTRAVVGRHTLGERCRKPARSTRTSARSSMSRPRTDLDVLDREALLLRAGGLSSRSRGLDQRRLRDAGATPRARAKRRSGSCAGSRSAIRGRREAADSGVTAAVMRPRRRAAPRSA